MFTSEEFRDFAASMGIKLLNSSPYYAQVNSQAEASNQIMIKLIKKKIKEQPRKWYSMLNEALWANRMAYHKAVLPWEIQTRSRHVTLQNDLSAEVYKNLMIDDLEDLGCHQLRALENIEANKLRIAKYYNKKVKGKQFSEGDLVWKVKLPIG